MPRPQSVHRHTVCRVHATLTLILGLSAAGATAAHAGTNQIFELRVFSGRRSVARVRGHARAGHNSIALRAPRTVGRYRIKLTATGTDGQTAGDRSVLIVA